jgi:hypothetical protein
MTAISDTPLDLAGGAQQPPPDAEAGKASCWLCGLRQPTARMVADGGPGCADVRWFCQAIARCTARWTEHGAIRPAWQSQQARPLLADARAQALPMRSSAEPGRVPLLL